MKPKLTVVRSQVTESLPKLLLCKLSLLLLVTLSSSALTAETYSQEPQQVERGRMQEVMQEVMEDSQEISVPLVLSARFKIKPEKRQLFLKLAGATLEPTRKEPGNISYSFYEESSDPNSFIYFEEWKSHEALALHLTQPYTQRLLERFGEMLAEEPNIRIYDIRGITYQLEQPAM